MKQLLRVGDRFDRWEVIENQEYPWVQKVKCKCDCGTTRKVDCNNLARGGTKSCGCYIRDISSAMAPSRIKHPVNVGDVYGRLTVINADVRTAIVCECACGTTTTVLGGSLVSGNTKSCGCWRSDQWSQTLRQHHARAGHTGVSRHPAYQAWYRLRNQRIPGHRAYNPDVKIFPAWEDANVFCADVTAEIGERPNKNMYVLQIDPALPFQPGNIMWAGQQVVGKRRNTAKLPVATRREIAEMVITLGFKQVEVARAYNVLPSYISSVVRQYRDGTL